MTSSPPPEDPVEKRYECIHGHRFAVEAEARYCPSCGTVTFGSSPDKPEGQRDTLDALEARAVEAIQRTYEPKSDTERFWIQKGIEGMRLAVAEASQIGPRERL